MRTRVAKNTQFTIAVTTLDLMQWYGIPVSAESSEIVCTDSLSEFLMNYSVFKRYRKVSKVYINPNTDGRI